MQYDKSFKLEALKLSDEIGVKKAAEQLGIPHSTLADWRYMRKQQGGSFFVGSGYQRKPVERPTSFSGVFKRERPRAPGDGRIVICFIKSCLLFSIC